MVDPSQSEALVLLDVPPRDEVDTVRERVAALVAAQQYHAAAALAHDAVIAWWRYGWVEDARELIAVVRPYAPAHAGLEAFQRWHLARDRAAAREASSPGNARPVIGAAPPPRAAPAASVPSRALPAACWLRRPRPRAPATLGGAIPRSGNASPSHPGSSVAPIDLRHIGRVATCSIGVAPHYVLALLSGPPGSGALPIEPFARASYTVEVAGSGARIPCRCDRVIVRDGILTLTLLPVGAEAIEVFQRGIAVAPDGLHSSVVALHIAVDGVTAIRWLPNSCYAPAA